MGEKIVLSGWSKFRGGLDNRGTFFFFNCILYFKGTNETGTHSYFTEFEGNEIMFHVAALLPVKENDPSRKRYIGNDVVVIIFKDSDNDDQFDPTQVYSQFNRN